MEKKTLILLMYEGLPQWAKVVNTKNFYDETVEMLEDLSLEIPQDKWVMVRKQQSFAFGDCEIYFMEVEVK